MKRTLILLTTIVLTIAVGAPAQARTLLQAICSENPPAEGQRESALCEQAHRMYNPYRLYFDPRYDSERRYIDPRVVGFTTENNWEVRAHPFGSSYSDAGIVNIDRTLEQSQERLYLVVVRISRGYQFQVCHQPYYEGNWGCVIFGRASIGDGDGVNGNLGWRQNPNEAWLGNDGGVIYKSAGAARTAAHSLLRCLTDYRRRDMISTVYSDAGDRIWPIPARRWCPAPNPAGYIEYDSVSIPKPPAPIFPR